MPIPGASDSRDFGDPRAQNSGTGAEWFVTSRDEVLAIHDFVLQSVREGDGIAPA
jgi:hypothetical protein